MNEKGVQLFILPYAGGSIASFRKLTELVRSEVDVVVVEYAGRGTRAKEPLAENIEGMLQDAAEYCVQRRNPEIPYAILGYSMGSLLSYDLIMRHMIPGKLQHFYIAAEISPQTRAFEMRQAGHPTEEMLLERARKLGGLNERMLGNQRFRDIYIKPMLSDYRRFFEYVFYDYGEKIPADATAFYCEKDTALKDVKKWQELTEGTVHCYEMGDNHFFIFQHYKEMAEIINKTIGL